MNKRDFPKIHFYDQDFVDIYDKTWTWIQDYWTNPKTEENSTDGYFIYPQDGKWVLEQLESLFDSFFLVYSNRKYPAYQNIDYFVLLADQTTREVREFMQGHNNRIQCLTIPNFIEPPEIQPVSQKEKQVIAAGRLHADKDFPSLLRIWAKVVPSHPDWTLKSAGEGELEQMLKQYAVQLKIENNVCFTGALDHQVLLEEMAKSACFALTSVSESFGLVLVEAMSCGTPPVAFDIRVGPATIIEDTVSGFLVPDRNEELFAGQLMQLMDHEELRDKMSQNATERAKIFYKDHVLQQWLKLLGR